MQEPSRQRFTQWLQDQVNRAGGLRAAAQKAGVSHSTLLRALEGGTLSLRTLEGIAKWTKVDLVHLLRLYGEDVSQDQRVEATLARVLNQHPELEEALRTAVDVLDDESLAQIVQFIQFQVQRRRGN